MLVYQTVPRVNRWFIMEEPHPQFSKPPFAQRLESVQEKNMGLSENVV